MAYWLFKSEPGTWSWQDQLAKGDKGEGWDGVRNHQAGNNMKAMQVGDLGFFYHSVNEKRIVGIVDVIRTWHLDPTDPTGRFGMVTVRAIKDMPTLSVWQISKLNHVWLSWPLSGNHDCLLCLYQKRTGN